MLQEHFSLRDVQRETPTAPSEDCRRIDLDTTLLHHFGEIAVADAVLAVPAHAQQDDRGWKAARLNRDIRAAP
jgi:hypothetical protein